MADLHKVRIIAPGASPFDAKVEIDGIEMKGLTPVGFEIKAGGEPAVLHLKFVADVEIEGDVRVAGDGP